jgi:hypothetical protein
VARAKSAGIVRRDDSAVDLRRHALAAGSTRRPFVSLRLDPALDRSADGGCAIAAQASCDRRRRQSMETFWTLVAFAVVIGLGALPFVLLALLWRASGRKRTA